MQPPVGWIPPEHRVFIYEDMTEEEIESVMSTMFVSEDGGPIRPLSRAEFDAIGVRKVIDVRDDRS
jgi:hypothetical protein